jgi:formyltetrahydrofolate deformylase
MSRPHHYTLTFSCPDRVGIVARVTGFFAGLGGWILSSSQHADEDSARYFMRLEVKADSLPFDHAELRRRFAPLAAEFDMDWRTSDSAVRRRVLLMVSTQEHCLYDLLARWQSKELDMEIAGVASKAMTAYTASAAIHTIRVQYLTRDREHPEGNVIDTVEFRRNAKGVFDLHIS